MIRVLFFAQVKELVGMGSLELEGTFSTAEEIRSHLATQGDKWSLALESGKLLVAINQTISPLTTAVSDGDEVAFFPPVTGG
ncbi:molybdopterin synthase sulfur carrier subunit [Enterovibrio norvegicus]|uniref:Molybdopterin synthase sulfur carrier subunit n=2 Tax=Enterovibrio norvegicus TaxID=188144 RepID=A0A2N7L9E1_9GAMM|nr:molybdopterin synthase sulfur carrier subunit [Enterovibrio norvegicus]MCC4800378.1 molybdopterin synthase sulfur carrier subunit [Enterovibrio norvegicus]OEF55284.1 molybdopterin synthase sulfur carrier subunit [Enterovibrio norvegicus]PMH64349.1 molybdopterin synthase sulfur carrier subunit [Enterovibrio norvegicus]PMI26299.1 molybdopterin synthase sulfur carrier subunit [Enterovibrio norvegicus]PMI35768.1 molybdopterin synthase sulfur carrier subunit [Enterovibrio norvegicus]